MLLRPTSGDDADELLALVHACDIAAVGFPDYDLSEVVHALRSPFSMAAEAPDGTIIGWACIEPGNPREWLALYVHPANGEAARVPLLEAVLQCAKERGKELRAAAIPTETEWIAALEEV